MSEYFVGSTGANNQTNFSSLSTSEVLDDLGLNTGDSPTFSGLFLEGSGNTIFSVDGSNGRLFGVTDDVTGTVFSVNDAAGLPIIEVESTADHDKITLGEYGSDLLVLSGQSTIEITGSQIASQSWVGQQGFITSETDDQNLNEVLAEGNTSSYGISVNQITGTALTIDTDTLFVDSTNDRVGIGTTSPDSKLQVKSSGSNIDEITLVHSGNTVKIAALGQESSHGSLYLRHNNGVNKVRLSAGGNSSYILDSNVGIGTNSPQNKLHVVGTKIRLDTNSGGFYQYTAGGTFRSALYDDSSKTYLFADGDGSNPHMTFDGGNVGIGTTSPSQKLHVVGNTITTGVSYTDIVQTYSGSSIDFRHQDASVVMRVDTPNARIGIGTTTPAYQLDIKNSSNAIARLHAGTNASASLRLQNDAQHFDVNLQTSDKFAIYDHTAGTQPFTILPTSGNVGIGTTSPEVLLHVGTATLGTAPDTNADIISSGGITIEDNKRLSFDTSYYVHGNIKYNGTASSVTEAKLEYQAHYGHNFITRSSSKMVISGNTGNVGIGTTSPEDKLDIVGNLRISDNKTANTNKTNRIRGEHYNVAEEPITFMFMNSFSTTNQLFIGGGSSIENAATSLTFFTAANNTTTTGTLALTIDSSQNATFAGAITANGNIVTTSASQIIASRKFSALNTSGVMLTDSGASNGLSIANGGNATFTHNLTVSGDLTVNGTTTTINSTTISVDDKNIELGSVASPTDTTADGGGITLLAGSNEVDHKTIKWVNSTDAWTFSERISIPAGSAAAPSLTFSNDTDTGIFRELSGASELISFSTEGIKRVHISSAGIFSQGNVYSATGGQFRNFAGVWKATTGTTGNGFQFISPDATALTISSTGDTVASGTVKASSYFLGSSTEISLATTGAGSVFLRPNGQSTSGQMQLESTGNATFAGKITSGNDIVNATAGVYTWVGDTDTYIQRSAANEITIKTGASNALVLDSSQNATFAGNITTNGDITIDNSSGDPFLKLKTSSQEYVVRIDQSDSEKFQIRNTTSSVTALSIDASSNATFAGSVTATGLDINGTADISGSLTLSGGSLIGDSNWDIFAEYTNRGRINLLSANATDTTTQIALMTNGNNRLTIDKAGTSTFAGDIIVDTPTGNSQTSHTLKLKKTNSGGSVQVGAEITSSPYATNTNGGNLVFKTANTSVSPTTALTLDGAQNATFAGDVTVNKLKMGNTQLYPSGDSNHIHFIGTALIGTSTTASSNPKIGTSAYPFSQVHAGYFYGDGSNLTNLPSAADNTKLPLAGGTLTGNVRFNDTIKAEFGSGADLQINHDGTQSLIDNGTGNLTIQNQTNDGDIIFKSDDGSGGITEYLRLDGGQVKTIFSKTTIHNDGVEAQFGNGADLKIYHTGANSYIDDIGTGSLYIRGANDVNIRSYNGGAGEQMIKAIANGAVELYHDNIKKFETTSTGVDITGHLSATTKSFLVDNPKTGGKLQYGVVESDQHSVLVRGKNDTETIELPEEWEWLVDEDSVTVDLTSIGQIQQLFVVSQDNKTIKIGGLATNGKYNYTVYGERKDVKKLEVNI